ncbi:hypothetical protein [Virgibacillus alimentarius]|uniref:hypothetical protein n=1 Tax=Virgibacillus alimentarius TaxID=698769 RepID=UPI000492FA7F|nr:hypothetical protein [Virgibacillus alimentarius]
MRPPMKSEITAHVPVLDDNGEPITDDYGRPVTKEVKSKARVQLRSNVIIDKDGKERQVNVEIDLPANVELKDGTEVTYTTVSGKEGNGIVESTEEIINLLGDKVHYRTVFANG